jgi:hypothetical protein
VDEMAHSTYAGIEKCTQNFLFFKLSITKPPAPGTLSPRVKYPGHKADDSYPSNANINNNCRYSSTPLYAFNVCNGTSCYLLPEGVKSLGRPKHKWDIKINLKKKQDGRMYTELIWLRTGTCVVLFWMWFQHHLTNKILNYCISLPYKKGV